MRQPLAYECVRVFVKLYSVTYTPNPVCPYGHREPSWERIQGYFSATHWGVFLLKMCSFYPLDRRSKQLFWVYVKADFVTSTLICGLPMVTPWLLVNGDPSMFWCGKKSARFSTRAEVTTFSLLRHAPRCVCVCSSWTTLSLSEGLLPTNRPRGFRIWTRRNEKMISGPILVDFTLRSDAKVKGSRTYLRVRRVSSLNATFTSGE